MPPLTVSLPDLVPAELATGLASDLGLLPALESSYDTRGVELEAVHIVIFTGVGTFFGAMIQQFGTEAATRLVRTVERLRQAAPHAHPDIRLVDESNQVVIILSPAAVQDRHAIADLLTLEREAFRSGVELRWDPGAQRWRGHVVR